MYYQNNLYIIMILKEIRQIIFRSNVEKKSIINLMQLSFPATPIGGDGTTDRLIVLAIRQN